jgi:hypothetical protein
MPSSPAFFRVKCIIFDHEDDSSAKHYLGKHNESGVFPHL